LGSWDSWVRLCAPHRKLCAIDSRNARVVSFDGAQDHLIALIGLDDVVVVRTPDATLICRADQAQSVRTAVAQLSADRTLRGHL
jgi:mannose-1-phosphate guanylyltransferase